MKKDKDKQDSAPVIQPAVVEQSPAVEDPKPEIKNDEILPKAETPPVDEKILPKMVNIQFSFDGVFFKAGGRGVPQPVFYKKDQVIFVEKEFADKLAEQGLRFQVFMVR